MTLTLTQKAVDRLRALLLEHPEDPVVRIAVRDVNAQRLSLSITLEEAAREEDVPQPAPPPRRRRPVERAPDERNDGGLPRGTLQLRSSSVE